MSASLPAAMGEAFSAMSLRWSSPSLSCPWPFERPVPSACAMTVAFGPRPGGGFVHVMMAPAAVFVAGPVSTTPAMEIGVPSKKTPDCIAWKRRPLTLISCPAVMLTPPALAETATVPLAPTGSNLFVPASCAF
jgi:hypothetical protein